MKNYTLERIDKAWIIVVSETYIDYKKDPGSKDFFFAVIDKADFPIDYDNLMHQLRFALKHGKEVDLILERRPGSPNGKQMMDYLVHALFW